MKLFTIGFTGTTAERFFTLLASSDARRLIDVRLNNRSQLAGFSKKDDLAFFLRSICGMDYAHMPALAPTQELLDAYRKRKGRWNEYERSFVGLMREREIERQVTPELLDGACLLCSEHQPDQCHRRLVAEYLQEKFSDVEVVHLV